ncbi:MAG: sodium:solute symporter [Bacteroidetes bacterium]|nr:sodium:solute symporter [Bacteroidota bacterium]
MPQLDPALILYVLIGYFLVLFGISIYTSRKANNNSFYLGNHQSPWYILVYGLIGTSISGISLLSVTGKVMSSSFGYMQTALGFAFGYFVIAYVLLPIYYRYNVTSIYQYLNLRYGKSSQVSGSILFLVSRSMGAAIRLSLMAVILHNFVFSKLSAEFPFWLTVLIILTMIYLYTFKGGIKTIIWTDTIQTTLLLLTVVVSFVMVKNLIHEGWGDITSTLYHSKITDFSPNGFLGKNSFVELFVSGVFLTVGMTGLDQAMMQRSLSARNLKDAQKNLLTFSWVIVLVNFMLLCIGALLSYYFAKNNLPLGKTDNMFFEVATHSFGVVAGIIFILGFAASTFSSSDDAMTAITTSFAVDFLKWDDSKPEWKRKLLHAFVALFLFVLIVTVCAGMQGAAIDNVLLVASYTYAPLLGMFFFGIITRKKVNDAYVAIIAVLTPLATVAVNIGLGMNYVKENMDKLPDDFFSYNLFNRIMLYVSKGNGNITIVYSAAFCALLLYFASLLSSQELE